MVDSELEEGEIDENEEIDTHSPPVTLASTIFRLKSVQSLDRRESRDNSSHHRGRSRSRSRSPGHSRRHTGIKGLSYRSKTSSRNSSCRSKGVGIHGSNDHRRSRKASPPRHNYPPVSCSARLSQLKHSSRNDISKRHTSKRNYHPADKAETLRVRNIELAIKKTIHSSKKKKSIENAEKRNSESTKSTIEKDARPATLDTNLPLKPPEDSNLKRSNSEESVLILSPQAKPQSPELITLNSSDEEGDGDADCGEEELELRKAALEGLFNNLENKEDKTLSDDDEINELRNRLLSDLEQRHNKLAGGTKKPSNDAVNERQYVEPEKPLTVESLGTEFFLFSTTDTDLRFPPPHQSISNHESIDATPPSMSRNANPIQLYFLPSADPAPINTIPTIATHHNNVDTPFGSNIPSIISSCRNPPYNHNIPVSSIPLPPEPPAHNVVNEMQNEVYGHGILNMFEKPFEPKVTFLMESILGSPPKCIRPEAVSDPIINQPMNFISLQSSEFFPHVPQEPYPMSLPRRTLLPTPVVDPRQMLALQPPVPIFNSPGNFSHSILPTFEMPSNMCQPIYEAGYSAGITRGLPQSTSTRNVTYPCREVRESGYSPSTADSTAEQESSDVIKPPSYLPDLRNRLNRNKHLAQPDLGRSPKEPDRGHSRQRPSGRPTHPSPPKRRHFSSDAARDKVPVAKYFKIFNSPVRGDYGHQELYEDNMKRKSGSSDVDRRGRRYSQGPEKENPYSKSSRGAHRRSPARKVYREFHGPRERPTRSHSFDCDYRQQIPNEKKTPNQSKDGENSTTSSRFSTSNSKQKSWPVNNADKTATITAGSIRVNKQITKTVSQNTSTIKNRKPNTTSRAYKTSPPTKGHKNISPIKAPTSVLPSETQKSAQTTAAKSSTPITQKPGRIAGGEKTAQKSGSTLSNTPSQPNSTLELPTQAGTQKSPLLTQKIAINTTQKSAPPTATTHTHTSGTQKIAPPTATTHTSTSGTQKIAPSTSIQKNIYSTAAQNNITIETPKIIIPAATTKNIISAPAETLQKVQPAGTTEMEQKQPESRQTESPISTSKIVPPSTEIREGIPLSGPQKSIQPKELTGSQKNISLPSLLHDCDASVQSGKTLVDVVQTNVSFVSTDKVEQSTVAVTELLKLQKATPLTGTDRINLKIQKTAESILNSTTSDPEVVQLVRTLLQSTLKADNLPTSSTVITPGLNRSLATVQAKSLASVSSPSVSPRLMTSGDNFRKGFQKSVYSKINTTSHPPSTTKGTPTSNVSSATSTPAQLAKDAGSRPSTPDTTAYQNSLKRCQERQLPRKVHVSNQNTRNSYSSFKITIPNKPMNKIVIPLGEDSSSEDEESSSPKSTLRSNVSSNKDLLATSSTGSVTKTLPPNFEVALEAMLKNVREKVNNAKIGESFDKNKENENIEQIQNSKRPETTNQALEARCTGENVDGNLESFAIQSGREDGTVHNLKESVEGFTNETKGNELAVKGSRNENTVKGSRNENTVKSSRNENTVKGSRNENTVKGSTNETEKSEEESKTLISYKSNENVTHQQEKASKNKDGECARKPKESSDNKSGGRIIGDTGQSLNVVDSLMAQGKEDVIFDDVVNISGNESHREEDSNVHGRVVLDKEDRTAKNFKQRDKSLSELTSDEIIEELSEKKREAIFAGIQNAGTSVAGEAVVCSQKEELELRERLLKSSLMKKVQSSQLKLQLVATENKLISSRTTAKEMFVKLNASMTNYKKKRVYLGKLCDEVKKIRSELEAAVKRMHIAKKSATLLAGEVRQSSKVSFAMRNKCIELLKSCHEMGEQVSGSEYTVPTQGSDELNAMVIQVRKQSAMMKKYKEMNKDLETLLMLPSVVPVLSVPPKTDISKVRNTKDSSEAGPSQTNSPGQRRRSRSSNLVFVPFGSPKDTLPYRIDVTPRNESETDATIFTDIRFIDVMTNQDKVDTKIVHSFLPEEFTEYVLLPCYKGKKN